MLTLFEVALLLEADGPAVVARAAFAVPPPPDGPVRMLESALPPSGFLDAVRGTLAATQSALARLRKCFRWFPLATGILRRRRNQSTNVPPSPGSRSELHPDRRIS